MDRILETDDAGALTIPPELLVDPSAHTRYVVEKVGESLTVKPLSPNEPADSGHEERMRRWKELGSRVARLSQTDRPSVDILSEMRR